MNGIVPAEMLASADVMITAQFRRTIWSERADVRPFALGMSIAQIVAAFDRPPEFERFGGVYLKGDRLDPGHVVPREIWHRVRPKPGTLLFVSLIPEGDGGGGDTDKQVFAIVGAIALIALSAGIGFYGLPGLFAGGTFTAQAVASGVPVGGSVALAVVG